ncbi:MAG: aldo/keto reductase [Candidatus Promineifilaceae bacterium]
MISGKATTEATQKYSQNFPQHKFQCLGKTGLHVSQVGFGSYRIDPAIHNHHFALQQSITSGINLIDTSSNYGDGGSEQLIGRVLAQSILGGGVSREALVVVSKTGYLQGSNYTMSQQRKTEGRPWPELVEHSPNLEHCIHPRFIEDQLTRSLERLGLDSIDVYLLHNPEYYLGWAKERNAPLNIVRDIYYDRIRRAFIKLEEEVARGTIGCYGISSNTFVSSSDDVQFTELQRIWEIAESISPDHHFRVVQLPMNLIETEAATTPNQPNGQSVLAYAKSKGLAVLINRPLNAVIGNTLTRLADAPPFESATVADVDDALNDVVRLEQLFQQQILPTLPHSPQVLSRLGQYIMAGQTLQGKWFTLGTYHQWEQMVSSFLLPRLNAARDFLSKPGNLPAEHVDWLSAYIGAVNVVFRVIGGVFGGMAEKKVWKLRQAVESAEPEWLSNTLSQTAIRALRSTSGVTSVLVGMRKPDYVKDILADLASSNGQSSHLGAWHKLAQIEM